MLTNDIFNLSQSEQLSVNIKVGLVFWREQRSKNAILSTYLNVPRVSSCLEGEVPHACASVACRSLNTLVDFEK